VEREQQPKQSKRRNRSKMSKSKKGKWKSKITTVKKLKHLAAPRTK
jgi:hypothetical protein